MTDEERILHDLSKHMQKKIMRVLTDHVSICEVAEIDGRDMAANLMSFLLHLTAGFAAGHFQISAGEFAARRARKTPIDVPSGLV